MKIRLFETRDAAAFRHLNVQWIVEHWELEPKDLETLNEPERAIIGKGGAILIAEEGAEPIGCCALLEMGPYEYEVAKMAVAPAHRRNGIGRALLQAVIEHARSLGCRRLFLETNSKLAPAIRLYESLGFRHLPAERVPASPYARSNVSMELILD